MKPTNRSNPQSRHNAGHAAMHQALAAGLGLLFAVLGNLMGKLTKNFFVGIRTPWTLASDEVWLRTHRFGGKVFVVTGLGLIVASVLGAGLGLVVWCLIVASLIPVVYSYVIYRRIEGFGGPPHKGGESLR